MATKRGRRQRALGRVWMKSEILSGTRLYFRGTVNAIKRAVGKLAKKVRVSGGGIVEVIHTANSHNGWEIHSALREFEQVSKGDPRANWCDWSNVP